MSNLPSPRATSALSTDVFPDATYTVRRPFWSLLGRTFRVFDGSGRLVMFVRHPVFKLREEFTLFADEAQTQPIARVQARQVVALNTSYDVTDPQTGERLGTLQAHGLRGLVRDRWDILDRDDLRAGVVEEEGHSLLRRFFPLLLGRWRIDFRDQTVGRIRQIFRFFVKEYALELHAAGTIDPRLAVTCAILALLAETRRESNS